MEGVNRGSELLSDSSESPVPPPTRSLSRDGVLLEVTTRPRDVLTKSLSLDLSDFGVTPSNIDWKLKKV